MLDFAGEEPKGCCSCGVSKTKFCNWTVRALATSDGVLGGVREAKGSGISAGAKRADFRLVALSVDGAVLVELARGSGDEVQESSIVAMC
jgi:hypothetical protein